MTKIEKLTPADPRASKYDSTDDPRGLSMTTPDLTTITLARGGHFNPEQGMCLMEAASYIAGERFGSRPKCVSSILGAYGRNLNDALPDDKRQRLIPLIPRLIGTAGDAEKDQARGLMAADWMIRAYTPTWLRLAGLEAGAVSLETLPRLASWDDVNAAESVVLTAKGVAAAARVAARGTARGAGEAAARADRAAGAAARVAAREAAWAAGAAAWDAAWDATDAAGAAAWDAGEAAARAALAPTVDALQDSAIDLYDQMINLAVSTS